MKISVVIPLYNKRAEIERTLRSVASQTRAADEIIVIDDGSTDGSAEIVEQFNSPPVEGWQAQPDGVENKIKLIRQSNRGVSVARNRGITESSGDYITFLDGDDWWEPNFLSTIAKLIESYPNCGAYATGVNLVKGDRTYPLKMPITKGVIADFWNEAMRNYILTASSVVVPRTVFDAVGGFPNGMRLGEDLYMWIKIASRYPICFTPERLANYCLSAANRSNKIYEPEQTDYSFEQLYDPSGEPMRNEFIASSALGKAITLAVKGDKENAQRAEHLFAYTSLARRALWRLRILNRLPLCLRPTFHHIYIWLAWRISKKGM